jgi:hypothetical protein
MNVKDFSDGNGDQDRERRDEHDIEVQHLLASDVGIPANVFKLGVQTAGCKGATQGKPTPLTELKG